MMLDKLNEENKDFYKDRFDDASKYCMRMISATNPGTYVELSDPLSRVGYLDVVSENCAEKIGINRKLVKILIPVVIIETITLLVLFFKYLY